MAGWIAIGIIALVVLGVLASVGDNQTTTAARQTDPPDPFGLDRDHDGVGCES